VRIPNDELPFPVARTPSQTPTAIAPAGLTIYLVRTGRLVPSTRTVDAEIPLAEAALQALLAGPTELERKERVETEIPPSTSLLEVRVFDGVADVDLSEEFQGPAEQRVILFRVAQIVWTLVGLPGITAVRFAIEGTPITVVTDRGLSVARPVTAPDFASVAPLQGSAAGG
jgi:spore germination protein GerM